MSSAYDRVKYAGRTFNRRTVEVIEAVSDIVGYKQDFYQGSYNAGVSDSANTHDGGGAGDATQYDWKRRNRVYRLFGAMSYRRGLYYRCRKVFTVRHIHFGILGDRDASQGLENQFAAYHRGEDAMAGRLKDTDFRPDDTRIEPVYGHRGETWVIFRKTGSYTQPTRKGSHKRRTGYLRPGTVVNVVLAVKSGGKTWLARKHSTSKYPRFSLVEDAVRVTRTYKPAKATLVAQRNTYRYEGPTSRSRRTRTIRKGTRLAMHGTIRTTDGLWYYRRVAGTYEFYTTKTGTWARA